MIGAPLPPEAEDFAWWCTGPIGDFFKQAGFGMTFLSGLSTTSGILGLGRGLHRWPGVHPTSIGFSDLKYADRLRQLAYGYLESGKVLCVSVGENPDNLIWPRALVYCHCGRHATELFYKSCILYRGKIEDCNHDIGNLKKQFRRLYPEPEFDVQTAYDIALVEREDQVLRYFADRSGKVPDGLFNFTPAAWLSVLECLELTMNRIYARIDREAAEAELGAAPNPAGGIGSGRS